jgi:hypothetical protein
MSSETELSAMTASSYLRDMMQPSIVIENHT